MYDNKTKLVKRYFKSKWYNWCPCEICPLHPSYLGTVCRHSAAPVPLMLRLLLCFKAMAGELLMLNKRVFVVSEFPTILQIHNTLDTAG